MMKKKSNLLKIQTILITSVALIGCGSGSTTTSPTQQAVYTTIFDAGSSGTRLSFYKVIPGNGGYPQINKLYEREFNDNGINDFLNGNGTIELTDKKGNNTLPGGVRPANCVGGTYESNGMQQMIINLGESDVSPCVLAPLLESQDMALTANGLSRSQVKTELFATAGMRTEDTRNGGSYTTLEIAEYYQSMKSYVARMGFATGEFKTINGNSEEGVWTWTNLNDYYYNTFGGNTTVSQTVQTPVGDFEVGGSSMQIAFPVNATPNDESNVYRVSINGKTFNVYSKTILGLGGDDARKYVRAYGYSNQNGGLDCFAESATVSNTTEDSGIALYPSTLLIPNIFPANTVTTAPWFTLSAESLNLTGSPSFNLTACSNKYNVVESQVVSLARNNNGTYNEGNTATISSLKGILQTSTSPFVGIDNFFYTAQDLNLAESINFNPATFESALVTKCASKIPGEKLFTQAICPNGTFMDSFLFGTNGLFNGGTASFAGVLSPRQNNATVLTWTRGYLLLKYAN
ncbi:MAG: hypothetical protein K2X04_08325 [Burkholderiales bacterium]|nr:hypothetical protein [Burkholderiales bacterium]